MVKQTIKAVDLKKLKKAKKLLSVFEVCGLKEKDIDNIMLIGNLVKEINLLKQQVADLQQYIHNTSRSKSSTSTIPEMLRQTFATKIEEYNPDAAE